MLKEFKLNLQLFAAVPGNESNALVNATIGYVDGVNGTVTAFNPNGDTLSPTLKTYYDMDLLENAREEFIFTQLGEKIVLPANHGTSVEKRKWDTLPLLDKLKEGTIPVGKKMSMTAVDIPLSQFGAYVTISDKLDTHAIDDQVLGATEELGASAGKTIDRVTRNAVMAGVTQVVYTPGKKTVNNVLTPFTPTSDATLIDAEEGCLITPEAINKIVTMFKKANVPFYTGRKYVAVIHPSVAYDLRQDAYWIDVHKYSATEEIFNGEIGELHGVRFVENNDALLEIKKNTGNTNVAVYHTLFIGKSAYGVVSPEGGNLETIIKSKEQAGGPINQFGTVGCKCELGAKTLYAERIIDLRTLSSLGSEDVSNNANNDAEYDVDYTPTT